MTVNELRKVLSNLPGDASISIGWDGGDEAVRTITITKNLKTVLVSQNNGGVLPTETVLYDETPEPRMD